MFVVVALLARATVVALVYRARYGRLHAAGGDLPAGLLSPARDTVTLLHFSSATCAPTRSARISSTA